MNSTAQKNELIFEYSSGKLGNAKSFFASMYLYLNSVAAKKASIFDNILANSFNELEGIVPKKINYTDCIKHNTNFKDLIRNNNTNPLTNFITDLKNINWKSVYKGFSEYNLPIEDEDSIKLIKMEPGTSVPLHSHNGKEFILVLDGSFSDEYGEYHQGDMQINDQMIKHNPIASKEDGCICLTITENEVVFFGYFGSILNLFTFIKSFFK